MEKKGIRARYVVPYHHQMGRKTYGISTSSQSDEVNGNVLSSHPCLSAFALRFSVVYPLLLCPC